MLSFTPPERLTDGLGRPYFLWDCDLTLDQFNRVLRNPDPDVRAYLVGKLMRQAKPDDVFLFVTPRTIRELWPRLTRYLGDTREFWTWLFDLDLFWRNRPALGELVRDATTALQADGLQAQVLRTAPAFAELRVADGQDVCVVDLVAEPFAPIEPPQRAEIRGASFAVDSRHEILVNKLTTLLSRSELRDLVDVKALLDAGGDLERALADAPAKDGGFSALTLAWVLKSFDPTSLARALGWNQEQIDQAEAFRRWLVDRLASASAPE